ncbi:MAG TPA: MBL fold metallo-hydrolase [Burkholderiales bacterium]|nr:MBL fold metallo-hydrolase [Burkholderiales bacterium]
MLITVWGCRGSLPTPGPDTLRYGGNTTCVDIVLHDGRRMIIDAGSGVRFLGKELVQQQTGGTFCLMLTHSHWDHLMGFPFFTPAYDARFHFNVCGGRDAQHSLQAYLQHQMEPPYFPVSFDAMKAGFTFGCKGPCRGPLGDSTVATIPLNHPNGGYGFKVTERGRSFVFLPDNEIGFAHPGGPSRDEFIAFCRDADVLFHDAQYTDEEYQRTRGWGHSTFSAATALAMDARVKRVGLFHHDPDRTDDALDEQLKRCHEHITRRDATTECFIVAEGMQIEL